MTTRHPLAGATEPGFRVCEFCGCYTNAQARACCQRGRDADRPQTGTFPFGIGRRVVQHNPITGRTVTTIYSGTPKSRARAYIERMRRGEGSFWADANRAERELRFLLAENVRARGWGKSIRGEWVRAGEGK